MNKSFKVVFSKARGALMVVNELTSSVQAKGTKTVIAAAVASLVAGGAMAADTAKPGALLSWNGTELVGQAAGEGLVYSTKDGVLTITATGQKTGAEGVPGYGVVTNLYHADATGGTDILAKTGVSITGSNFKNNASTNAGGAVTLWQDGGAEAQPLAHRISASTFEGNSANFGGAVALMNQMAFAKNDGTILSEGNVYKSNTGASGGAIYVEGSVLTSKGDVFTKNKATAKGGAVYVNNKGALFVENGRFEENSAVRGGAITNDNGSPLIVHNSVFSKNTASEYGGALFHGNGQFEVYDSEFTNNTSTLSGGAVYTDANSLTFDATSASDVISFTNNTATAANGGSDLYLGKHTRVDTDKANYKAAEVNLTGLGTISFGGSIAGLAGTSINSSAAKVSIADAAAFAGDFTITDGLTQISGAKFFGGKVSVEGGTLAVDGAWTASGSTTLKGGMITTAGANVFKKGDDGKYGTTLTDGWTALNKTNGKVELTDTGYDYTIEQLRAAQDALNGGSGSEVQLVLHGTLTTDKPLTDTTVDGLIAADQTVSANASGNFVVSNATTVGSIDFKEAENAESVAITTGTATLTIEGNGGDVFANLSDTVKTVDASNSSVALGQSEESKGSVNVETLKVKNLEVVGTFDAVNAEVESLDVSGNFTAAELKVAEGDVTGTLSADKLTGTADKVINVGDDVDAGTVHLDTLALNGGTIFLDPSWTGDDTIDKGSFLAVTNLKDSVLTGRIVVGQNSTLALGGTKAETVDAFNRLGKSWGEDGVTAALYVGKTLSADVLKDAGILVDGSLEKLVDAGDLTSLSGIKMNAGSMLIVNQAGVGSGTAIDGKLAMSAASTLGIVNATEGTFKLASDLTVNAVDQDTTVEVVTDNPFISGSFGTGEKANTVTTTFDSESGLGAIASTGVQAMARRADFVMTETVANRTSLDQPMHAGVNLWADVSGERYEADKLDNNGSFRADAAYATFGGDVEVLEGLTAGLALQYGDASLRSDVSGIKNDITSYGLTAYAGKSFGAAKVVGELAWLKSENDITAHQTALNQKLDANIYSAGVRAQYELAAGSFKFVPSIGLRVSRLETDDMTVGSIKVDEGDLTYVQMPISLRISGFEADAAGWTLAPSFKVAYVPTFGDKEVKVLGYSQDVLDMSPVQADFGLRAVNGNLMFNVDMMLGGGEAGTSSIGGKVGVKYAF